MQMNNGNFDDRNRITGDGGPENQETPRARDVWHKKLYGAEAVSYTHLDVYKRQGEAW